MLMKLFRVLVVFAFFAAVFLFAHYYINVNFKSDVTIPVITIETDTLEIPLNATDEDLLKGVTAYDEKDGDLTDSVMVESISKFTVKGISTVTYVVCDSDKHVTTATRKITYKNYTSPRFSMNSALCFSSRSEASFKGVLSATDCIDGDISNNIVITSADYTARTAGYYTCTAKVSNSKGDTVTLDLPIVVEDRSPSAPVLTLTEYLIYIKKGSKPDFRTYLKSVTDIYDSPVDCAVTMVDEVRSDTPGVYEVHYYAEDAQGRTGHTLLIVVVEG